VITFRDVLGQVQIDEETLVGRKLLRLSGATPNLGPGRLEIRGSTPVSDTQQEVVQRVYRDDGSFWERSAGTSTYHPEHHHIHFDDWLVYRLRVVTASGGVGDVVTEGHKTSFCLSDLVVYDASNPYISFSGNYTACGFSTQGISPGWMDIYDLTLPDQWIDITGVPDGSYWLEAEVDPLNKILEADETNNVARVIVSLGPPPPAVPDRYEENDSTGAVDVRVEAATNSPNLGLVTSPLVLDNLSMEDEADYFKFRLGQAAAPGGFVRMDSPYLLNSDLDLALLDANGTFIKLSVSESNLEQVSLSGLPPGDYYCAVAPFFGQNPAYRLIIDPSGTLPPSITVTAPVASGVWVERGYETLAVGWTASDPEGRSTTVSLSIDRDQTLDKGTRALQGYQNLAGEAGQTHVNTAGLDLGTWYVYASVTVGGGRSDAWAPGPFVLYEKGDVNFDRAVDMTDRKLVQRRRPCDFPPGWEHILDMDRDGDVDRFDFRLFWSAAAGSGAREHADPSSLLSRKRQHWFVRR
jgi:hypothetical protein